MSLGSSFWRDLLYTAAKLLRHGDSIYTGFYRGECLVNDMGNSPCHFMDILYDAFYVTACQHWYVAYQHGNVGGNCIMGKMAAM